MKTMSRPFRLLAINPNTSIEVTRWVTELIVEEADPSVHVAEVTATFGYRYISSRVAMSIASHAVLDAAASVLQSGLTPDAILVACFGDPGIDALAEMTGLPVIGFAEAGILTALEKPGKCLLATKGQVWHGMLSELVLKLGVAERIAGIVIIDAAGDDPAAIAAFLDNEALKLGAECVILGGAGLIPLIPGVMKHARVAMLDPHREAVRRALRKVGVRHSPAGRLPASDVSGLSRALSSRLTDKAKTTGYDGGTDG